MNKETKFEKRLRREWKNIIFNCIFSIAIILIVILFYKNILLTIILEAIVVIIGLIKWKSKLTLAVFLFGAFWGAIAEMVVIYTSGALVYSLPNILNLIPAWLFIIWGAAAAFIFETANEIKSLGVKDG